MLSHALTEHGGIHVRVAWHERLSEEPGEGTDRVGNAGFGACQFAGVAHQEPEHGLFGGEPGNWWKHAVGVGCQE